MILKPHLLTDIFDVEAEDKGTVLDGQVPTGTGDEAFSFNTIYGTEQHDQRLNGTNEDDLIFALGGKDQVHGREGNDIIHGGDYSDRLYGGADSDVLNGGKGNDVLVGDFWSYTDDPDPDTKFADFFVFDIANWGNDRILDFDDDLDKIVFGGTSGVTGFDDLEIQEFIHPSLGDVYTKITFDDGIGESSIRLFNFTGVIDQGDFIF